MEKYYNVNCPKDYGLITFLPSKYCPVSGASYCVNCDVIGIDPNKEYSGKFQVEKKSEK